MGRRLRLVRYMLVVLPFLALTSCARLLTGSSVSEIVDALAKDDASACFRVKADPGLKVVASGAEIIVEFCRTNSNDASVVGLTGEGIQIHHNIGFRTAEPKPTGFNINHGVTE